MRISSIIRNLRSRPLSESIAIARDLAVGSANRVIGFPAKPFAIRKVRRAVARPAVQRNLVVFVSQKPRGREAKIAHSLRNAGWQVVLLHEKAANFDLSPYFDETKQYRNEWHALSLASTYRSAVYHVFSAYADSVAKAFVTNKPGKVVLDIYDTWESFRHVPSLDQGLQLQRFCIQHADALCCRDLQLKHVARRQRFSFPAKAILFADYCWNRTDLTPPEKRRPEEIHVVLAGSFGVEKRGFGDAGYLDIAEKFAAERVHLHIYPHSLAVAGKQCESDYVELATRTPYLQLHRSVPMDELIPQLAQYDAGIAITKFLSYGEQSQLYDPDMFRYCGSSRVSDYLDAGLPVITNCQMEFMYFVASRYGIAVNGSLEMITNARRYLEPLCSDGVRAKISRSRALYSVDRHGKRLTEFYASL